jgi:hypothetical protein
MEDITSKTDFSSMFENDFSFGLREDNGRSPRKDLGAALPANRER